MELNIGRVLITCTIVKNISSILNRDKYKLKLTYQIVQVWTLKNVPAQLTLSTIICCRGIYHLSIWNLWVMRLGDRKWICSRYWRQACTFKQEFEHYEKLKLNEIKGVAKCNKYSVNVRHIVEIFGILRYNFLSIIFDFSLCYAAV